ncbi:protein zinc induced facilitator-like [Anaeramoeba flamelloides]|uniref:Protein zinc induced facilitator-like n=1 Tax=Anaeramoeba flamelloides TaxID=1746091 RepID=A0AAV7ZRB7_9EUKA|nr:protein zinc induced facilitator-like [Anaeramoeba flamelloides]
MLKNLPRVLLFAFFSELLLSFLYICVVALLSEYAREIGSSGTFIGLIASAYSVTELFSNYFFGWLSDKYGRAPILAICDLALALCTSITGVVSNKWYLIIIRLITGLFSGILPVGQAACSDLAVDFEQNNIYQSYIIISQGLGCVFGPLLVIILSLLNFEFRGFCLISGLLMFVLSLIGIIFVKETRVFKRPKIHEEKEKLNQNDLDLVDIVGSDDNEEKDSKKTVEKETQQDKKNGDQQDQKNKEEKEDQKKKESEKNTKKKLRFKDMFNKDVIILIAMNYLLLLPLSIIFTILPLLIVDVYNKNPNIYSNIIMFLHGSALTASCLIFYPFLIRKTNNVFAWNYSLIVQIICFIPVGFITNFWIFFAIYAVYIWHCCVNAIQVIAFLIFRSTVGMEGQTVGLSQVFQALSRATAPIIGMYFYEKGILYVVIFMASVFIFLLPFLYFTDIPKLLKRKRSNENADNK